MTKDKAIEILTINNDHNLDFTDAEREVAHQMGIGALKWVRDHSDGNWHRCNTPLPGETL